MGCQVCHTEVRYLFTANVLNKYPVAFFQCPVCGLCQTEHPFWLEESYLRPINRDDTGLLNRNIFFADYIGRLLEINAIHNSSCLDFGGGYGVLTRLMRDKGYAFFHEDKYTENLFADGFDVCDLPDNAAFGLISLIEVIEHSYEPMSLIGGLLERSDTLLISTELYHGNSPDSGWWYLGLAHGQHVTFYTSRTLSYIAEAFKISLVSNNRNIHVLSKDRKLILPDIQKDSFFATGKWIRFTKRYLDKFRHRNI